MSGEHTPGHWYAEGRWIKVRASAESLTPLYVAQVAGDTSESHANACLIAAAPAYKAARDSLFAAIAHGDQAHRDWLEAAILTHFADADAQATGA